jgi:electron transport complex protein RnfC
LFPGPGTFAHGVHPPQRKELAADAPIEIIPPPEKIILPLQQHIGGPCTPIVKPKQSVAFGEMIGKGEAFVSASLHAPLAGIVQKMEVTTLANGRHMQAIVIRGESEQLCGQTLWDKLFAGNFDTIVVGRREVISFTQEHFRCRASEKINKSLDNMAVWVMS